MFARIAQPLLCVEEFQRYVFYRRDWDFNILFQRYNLWSLDSLNEKLSSVILNFNGPVFKRPNFIVP